MTLTGAQIGFVLIFFIYGLGFFSMGIALMLETGRSPMLAERRLVRPLGIFGLMHGMHEWVEIILLQGVWLGVPFPKALTWLRVCWLALSFMPLVIFGVRGHIPRIKYPRFTYALGILWLLAFFSAIYLVLYQKGPQEPQRLDALSRYFLAVPSGILAALAFHARSRQVKAEQRLDLAACFEGAAAGFLTYGLTQIFVPHVDFFPAMYINADSFSQFTGMPVQIIRAAMAVLITVNLIRAIQIVEREREHQLVSAQQERLDALEQIRQELVARENMRRELLRHTVIAQEEERSRIARELHDETAQVLTALNLNLATLTQSLPRRPEVKELSGRLQNLFQQMSQGIYRLVHDLRPAQLDDLGLVAALKYLADEEHNRLNLAVYVDVQGQRRRLDTLVETVIFRVAQEALTNTGRHAQTDHAWVSLSFSPAQVVLKVRDEGCGFDPNVSLVPPHGWGLAGMRERVESVSGELRVVSAPGQGTTVEACIPIAEIEYKENVHGEPNSSDAGG